MKDGSMSILKHIEVNKKEMLVRLCGTIILLCISFSCAYDDFKEDYEYSTVYFANQINKRNFVEDEVNTIKIGVVLGGKRVNTKNEWVEFIIRDESGMSGTGYTLMPEKYYNLSSTEEFTIGESTFQGEIDMTVDPSFFDDPQAVNDHYALLFKLRETSAGSINPVKDSLILILGFESRFFGNYYHNGLVIRTDTADGSTVDTIQYHQEEPVTNRVNNWSLKSRASNTVSTDGIANYAPSDITGFMIRVDDSYNIEIMEDTSLVSAGYDWKVKQLDGNNTYDPESRMFYLNYEFTDFSTGYRCFVTDTLLFRNRILDGVNQWDF